MTRLILVLLGATILCVDSSAAPTDDEPGPYCQGRELGITRGSAAYDFASNYCSCNLPPESQQSCVDDMRSQLLVGDPDAIICGSMVVDGVSRSAIVVYDECFAETAACGGLPSKCWELTGWDL